MPISESQLETWSHQGSITQSAATYETIRSALNESTSQYYQKSFSIFLQGSYANATNVYSESDVDIVIRLDSTFAYNLGTLDQQAQAAFHQTYSNANYSFQNFRGHVLEHLVKKYGNAVTDGSKAISIEGNGTRRDADVLPCIPIRKYTRFGGNNNEIYVEGIRFFRKDSTIIDNFPRQHSANCTAKHQSTGSYFKPLVRIAKNMRNRLLTDKLIEDGIAPSYFVEGLFYNAPDNLYKGSYQDAFVSTYNWLLSADSTQFLCANEQHYLIREGHPITWTKRNYEKFMSAMKVLWTNW